MENNDLKLSHELNDELIKLMKQEIQNFDKVYERMKPFVKGLLEKMKEKAAEDLNVFSNFKTSSSLENLIEKIDICREQSSEYIYKKYCVPFYDKEGSEAVLFSSLVTQYYYTYYLSVFINLKIAQKQKIIKSLDH